MSGMNRRERRVASARAKITESAAPDGIADLLAEAHQAHQQRRAAQAEAICKRILERAPAQKTALNLLGVIYQDAGRHRLAVKLFAKAIAADQFDAACHYNIATSYQLLNRRPDAAAHFKTAIALGLSDQASEDFVLRNSAVQTCVRRIVEPNLPGQDQELPGAAEIAAIANDIFIQSALKSTIIRGFALELFLTRLRSALLSLAVDNISHRTGTEADSVELFCALAQQCFITEYVFALGDEETRQAEQLRDLLLQKLTAGDDISPVLLAAVAAYFPLHSLTAASSLLSAQWPESVTELLQQQVREPCEEAEDRRAIPALTAIDDVTSLEVMQQYEENPYPRWTINQLAVLAADMKRHAEATGGSASGDGQDILIAGCGSGQHAFDTAQRSPAAQILAIDLSRTSLAYARRKTREEGLRNIEYAQADILKLGAIGRCFDRIESMGVLHHLADPKAGWRVLLSLLKPNGAMRIGLYSQAARRTIVEARALIAERGYRATAEGIRAARQVIIRKRDEPRWNALMTTVDFHSMSGCRDMLFNVMEHRFTIADIAAFLDEQGLRFLGFELPDNSVEKFQQRYPGADALTNLDYWNAFETANPDTFRHMYVFTLSRK